MRAEAVDDRGMICKTPEMGMEGMVDVKVSNNGVDYDSGHVKFFFHSGARVVGLEPSLGPVRGGTPILIKGVHLKNSSLCWFGSVSVFSEFISEGMMRCRSPQYAAGHVLIRISDNVSSIETSVRYLFVEQALISFVVPTIGSASGGDLVTVIGSHFVSDHVYCKFGDASTSSGLYTSSSIIRCIVPPMKSSSLVMVHLLMSAANESSAKPAAFQYLTFVDLLEILPSVGPVAGGSAITVLGDFAETGRALKCRGDFHRRLHGRHPAEDQTGAALSRQHLAWEFRQHDGARP